MTTGTYTITIYIMLMHFLRGEPPRISSLLDFKAFSSAAGYTLLPNFCSLVCLVACSGLCSGRAPFHSTFLGDLPHGSSFRICESREAAALATLCGVTAGDLLCGIGLTYGDIPVAALLVTSVWAGLEACRVSATKATALAALGMGLAAGSATALKLTAATFLPALLLGLAAALGMTRRLLVESVCVGAGTIVAFASLYGPWGWSLWTRYRNPFFPFFNGVFHSPWLVGDFGRDTRFLPRSTLQALLYPFYWLRGKAFVVSETGVGDWRLAIAYCCLIVVALTWVMRGGTNHVGNTRRRFFCVFFVAAFITWEAEFSVLRYASALEALSGLFVTAAIQYVWPRGVAAILGCAFMFMIATTSLSGWGRIGLREAGLFGPVFAVAAPPLPDRSLVLFPDHPSAFVAPFLRGHRLRFASLDAAPGSPIGADVRSAIMRASDIRVIYIDGVKDIGKLLAGYGLIIDESHCASVITGRPRWGTLTVCAAHQ